MYNNHICFTNFPNVSELLCLFAIIKEPEKVNTSYYNLIIKKCRQLIFDNSTILASPSLDEMYGIYIIVKESFYETGKLQKYLNEHNLKANAPTVVQKNIYEDCCMYTITAKLAPKWNLVANYFIRGRDFLINTDKKDCICLRLTINDKGDTTMIFEISRIKLPSMSLDKLDLPNYYIQELNQKNNISFDKFESKTIRVLPSLKRGNILEINLKIKDSWTFQTYNHIKRHWKNTYGYRLPETDKDIFYLDISFFDGSPVFTYPSICVRPFEPTFIQRVEPGPVVAGFITDLMKLMPDVLGDKYSVPSYITQPRPILIPSTKKIEHKNECFVNLKLTPDTQSSAIIYLPTQTPQNTENNNDRSKLSQLLNHLNKPENKVPIYLTPKTPLTQGISQTPSSVIKEKNEIINTKINIKNNKLSNSSILQEIQNQAQFLTEKLAENTNMTPKKIPTFSKQKIERNDHEVNNNNKGDKIVPTFVSKFPKIKKIKNIPESAIKPTQKEVVKIESKIKQIQKEIVKTQSTDEDLSDFQEKNVVKPLFKMTLNKPKEIQAKQHKRSSTDNTQNTVAKKPREKSGAVDINNMKELMNNGTINKLNKESLLKWLRERNIHCTTKDKKSVLIEKVISNINKK